MTAVDQPKKASAQSAINTPKITTLIIDTNAIVNGLSLRNLAEEFYTCPEVLAEVRSSHSREYLTRLPFEILVRQPTEESLKAVVEFSKKTGDYASLSVPDLKVLALAHTFAMKAPGSEGIRSEPVKTRPSGVLPSAPPPPPTKKQLIQEPEPLVDEDGWEIATRKKSTKPAPSKASNPSKQNKKKTSHAPKAVQSQDTKPVEGTVETAPVTVETAPATVETTPATVETTPATVETTPTTVETIPATVETTPTTVETTPATVETTPTTVETTPTTVETTPTTVEHLTHTLEDVVIQEEYTDDDSDAGEWITPENVEEFQAAQLGVTPEEMRSSKRISVACVTSDFAMQNVILQMNMNLVSAGGHRITKVKNWVLRCHACFTVTNNMEKKFCPKCGNASLMRVSCSTNSKGQTVYYLKRNFNYNLRGTKYDLPPPKGGRQVNNIVLREDQNEYVKATRGHRKKKLVDLFDPDITPIYGKVETRTPGNNMYGTKVIGHGKKNPNATSKNTGK